MNVETNEQRIKARAKRGKWVRTSNPSLNLAIAMALLRSKLLQKPPDLLETNAQRWKRKAKERNQELLMLRDELKELEVRLKERRRRPDDSVRQRRRVLDLNSEDEIEQLRTSVDFLVEICNSVSPVEDTGFTNLSHQAVDFILESCDSGSDAQFYVQHLIRKLGSAPNIGQRTLLSVSQRISVLADTSHFMDPFDDAFPNMHTSMFMMIQLTEFLISDYIQTWSSDDSFEDGLFGELLRSILQARKALELLEFRNGLYVLYMDRVTGDLAKQVGQVCSLQLLNPDILDYLFQ